MQHWLEFLRYSRVQFCMLSMSLAAASSKVLVGRIEWQPVLIVGLSTHAIYTLDNLIDISGERHLIPSVLKKWKAYFLWCVFTVLPALVIILVLALNSKFNFVVSLAGFGMVSLAHILLTRKSATQSRSTIALWGESLSDSLMWALVIVLVPVQYTGQRIVAQVIMAIIYMWQLSWVGVIVWNLTHSIMEKGPLHTQCLSTLLGESRVIRLLRVVSLSSWALAVADILLGYFPWYNLSVTSGPIVSLVLLAFWNELRKTPKLFDSLFYLANTFCGLIVVATYTIAERRIP